jgi:uncharacterized protein
MLLQFSVSNYRAFRDLQTLNLAASNYDKALPENCIIPELPGLKSRRWVKGAAIYGANASGKSTLLKALESFVQLVGKSAKTTDPQAPIPQIEPFELDPAAAEEPTAFAITFVNDGVRYEYRVAATKKIVWHESLRAFPLGKEQVWFVREWSDELQDHIFSPESPKGLPRDRAVEKRTLPNMLYLSKAIAENRKELEPVFRWLVNNLQFLDLSTRSGLNGVGEHFTLGQLVSPDSKLKDAILTILRHADLGIDDARIVGRTPPSEIVMKFVAEAVFPKGVPDKLFKDHWKNPELTHRSSRGVSLPLAWEKESAGTQRLFALVGPWLDILQSGYTVCVDELETSMHPLMVRELLRLFFSDKENASKAQIIFTTHNPLLLDPTLIRRDQVWFTDKDDEGRAHLYPLTDYEPRVGESLVRGYLAGRYGAVPFVPEGLLGTFPAVQTLPEKEEAKE